MSQNVTDRDDQGRKRWPEDDDEKQGRWPENDDQKQENQPVCRTSCVQGRQGRFQHGVAVLYVEKRVGCPIPDTVVGGIDEVQKG